MAKSLSKSIQKLLSDQVSELFDGETFFILGVSGGPDSMALLYLFHKLGVKGLVVHVNYGKRGRHSDQDQELTEQMAFQWGFECCSVRLNPDDAKGKNFQNWARKQRYQFFRDLKKDYEADAIALAHHRDDQVETIMQKVFRGSSPAAWQGMQSWDGELFRPLLPFTKQQILDYCESEAIPFRIDESNERSDFARNLIRNEFSDNMDELLPGWKQNVLDLARHGQTYETAVNLIAQQVFKKNTIKLKKYDALPELLKPAILKSIFDQLGLEGEYSKGQLEELADLESLQTGKSLHIGNFNLTRDREVIHFHPKKETRSIKKKITRDEAEQIWKFEGISLMLGDKSESGPALQLDASVLVWPLTLRNWESGDSFTPLGMSGSQKISDHLTNRKIPTISREKALVLCGSDGTIYAIIYPLPASNGEWGAISEMAKKTPKSQTFLTINIS